MSIEDLSFWSNEAVKYTETIAKAMKEESGE